MYIKVVIKEISQFDPKIALWKEIEKHYRMILVFQGMHSRIRRTRNEIRQR